jgi:hypothetical protein
LGVLFVCVCVRSSDKRVGVKEREGEEAQEATDEKQASFLVKSKFSGCVVQDCK